MWRKALLQRPQPLRLQRSLETTSVFLRCSSSSRSGSSNHGGRNCNDELGFCRREFSWRVAAATTTSRMHMTAITNVDDHSDPIISSTATTDAATATDVDYDANTTTTTTTTASSSLSPSLPLPLPPPPLYVSQGLFSVIKPVNWTSSDVVAYIRGILERDARNRGARPNKISYSRKRRRNDNDSKKLRVGHGGTLDPLATGVLVIGVGQGTKELQSYLAGSKCYRAIGQFGLETTTLDLEGNITRRASYDHITCDAIEQALPQFVGTIAQIPPVYSAIRKGGQKLYEVARKLDSGGNNKKNQNKVVVGDDDKDDATSSSSTILDQLEPRQVQIHRIELVRNSSFSTPFALPQHHQLVQQEEEEGEGEQQEPPPLYFEIVVECGGGTYIRSLIRDIGYQLNSVATTAFLERTRQGNEYFSLENSLTKEQWSAEAIYQAIDRFQQYQNQQQQQHQQSQDETVAKQGL